MADPVVKTLNADEWTLVLENATTGIIHIRDELPKLYLHTFRTTGSPAPVDDVDAVRIYGHAAELNTDDFVDVYIKAVGAPGKVRVDSS
jgi:hypothetical protein